MDMLSIQAKFKVIMYSIFLSAIFDEGVEHPTINRAKICSATILHIPTYVSINKHTLVMKHIELE